MVVIVGVVQSSLYSRRRCHSFILLLDVAVLLDVVVAAL